MPSNLSPKTRYAARKPSETNPNAIFDYLTIYHYIAIKSRPEADFPQ